MADNNLTEQQKNQITIIIREELLDFLKLANQQVTDAKEVEALIFHATERLNRAKVAAKLIPEF